MGATAQIPKAVLKMPSKIGDQIIRVTDIKGKLTSNSYFSTGWIAGTLTQTQFNSDVQAFLDAETAVNAKTPGAVNLRETAFTTLKKDLRAVMAMVQTKADANSGIAATIIESAGFFVSTKGGGHNKRQNAAYNTEVLGTIVVTSDEPGHTQWQMSKDMTTIITLESTNTSRTTVPGLTPGDVWYFRCKKVNTKKKTYNWCGWILLKIGPGGKNLGGGHTSGAAGNLATT